MNDKIYYTSSNTIKVIGYQKRRSYNQNLLYFISFIMDRSVDQIRRKFPDANFFGVKINTSIT